MYSSAVCFLWLHIISWGGGAICSWLPFIYFTAVQYCTVLTSQAFGIFLSLAFGLFLRLWCWKSAASNYLEIFPGAHKPQGFHASPGEQWGGVGVSAQHQFQEITPDCYSQAVHGFFWTSFQNVILSDFENSASDGCNMASNCCLDLNFPD